MPESDERLERPGEPQRAPALPGPTRERTGASRQGGSLALVLAPLLSACAGTQWVRFEEPQGARVRIEDFDEPRVIPFTIQLSAQSAYAVELEFEDRVLSEIGFSVEDVRSLGEAGGGRLRGYLICPRASETPSVFRLDADALRAGLLQDKVVRARDEDPDRRLSMVFKGSAGGIPEDDDEIRPYVGRVQSIFLTVTGAVVIGILVGSAVIVVLLLSLGAEWA